MYSQTLLQGTNQEKWQEWSFERSGLSSGYKKNQKIPRRQIYVWSFAKSGLCSEVVTQANIKQGRFLKLFWGALW